MLVILLAGALSLVFVLRERARVYPYLQLLESLNITRDSSDESIAEAIEVLNESFRSQCPVGSVVGITRHGGQRLFVSQGLRTIGQADTPVDKDSLFEIGSISKPMTGLVFAKEIAEGRLTLETKLNDLLPSSVPPLRVQGEFVTLSQLMTHTAGFPREPSNRRSENLAESPYVGFTEDDFLEQITIAANQGLSQSREIAYSNFGLSILAYVLGKNAGTSFPDL